MTNFINKCITTLVYTVAILATLMITTPAQAESILPDFSETEQYTYILYGGGDGQEAIYSFYTPLNEDTGGLVLNNIAAFTDLTPSAIYGWYRYSGSIGDNNPEEAHDYYFGTQFAMSGSAPGDILYRYVAVERADFNSIPSLDYNYVGVGLEWNQGDIKINTGAWSDFDANYRITGNTSFDSEYFYMDTLAWMMIDSGNVWGYWKAVLGTPIQDNVDLALIYEDSTRSNPIFMIGTRISF